MANFSDNFPVGSSNNLLEEIQASCDGSSHTVPSGTYTPQTVSAYQLSTNTHTDINGSSITYTPPSGTNYVYYNFRFNINIVSNNYHSGHSSYRLYVGGTEVTAAGKHFSTNYHPSYGHGVKQFDMGFTFNLTTSTDDIANGEFSNWTAGKIIKVTGRQYNSTYTVEWHGNKWRDGGGASGNYEWTRPILTIKALK